MSPVLAARSEKSRLSVLLEHLSTIDDPRDVRRILHPLAEILFLVVCGTIADCDDYDDIAAWGEAHLDFLRRHLPFLHGVPGGRWLTILMNRVSPELFQAAFTAWVRQTWPDRPEFIAIDGKTSRRSHDRATGEAPLHLVSAFATTSRLVLGQEAVADKSNELTAIPILLARLAEGDRLHGALVSIDAIATNRAIAGAIRKAGADYLLAVKANQPSLRAEIEACFDAAPAGSIDTHTEHDKGHGRIEQRDIDVIRETDWLSGDRRFPGELRLPDAACIIRVRTRVQRGQTMHVETRYYIRPAALSAGSQGRTGGARPLGDRKPAALGARRHVQRGSVETTKGFWRQKHGRRPTFRFEPCPIGNRQEIDQAPTQGGSLENGVSRQLTYRSDPMNLDSWPWVRDPGS